MLSQEHRVYIQLYESCSLLQRGTLPQASLSCSLFWVLKKLEAYKGVYKQVNMYKDPLVTVCQMNLWESKPIC